MLFCVVLFNLNVVWDGKFDSMVSPWLCWWMNGGCWEFCNGVMMLLADETVTFLPSSFLISFLSLSRIFLLHMRDNGMIGTARSSFSTFFWGVDEIYLLFYNGLDCFFEVVILTPSFLFYFLLLFLHLLSCALWNLSQYQVVLLFYMLAGFSPIGSDFVYYLFFFVMFLVFSFSVCLHFLLHVLCQFWHLDSIPSFTDLWIEFYWFLNN